MNTRVLHTTTGAVVVLSLLTHIFCCVLPLVMSITSLASILGFTAVHEMWESTFHAYEVDILIFSGSMLLVGGLSALVSHWIDCRRDAHCAHDDCAPKKRWSEYVLLGAAILFICNLALYLFFPHG